MAGMGGILICGILENCPYRNDKAFVLQPMSDPDTVRSWLYANGFDITKEKPFARESGCMWSCAPNIAARATGRPISKPLWERSPKALRRQNSNILKAVENA